jgi:hypothetical protein
MAQSLPPSDQENNAIRSAFADAVSDQTNDTLRAAFAEEASTMQGSPTQDEAEVAQKEAEVAQKEAKVAAEETSQETPAPAELAQLNLDVAQVNKEVADGSAQPSETQTIEPQPIQQPAQPSETQTIEPQPIQQPTQPSSTDTVMLAQQALQNALQALAATKTVLEQLETALGQSPTTINQTLKQDSLRTQASMVAGYGRQALTFTTLAQQNVPLTPQGPQGAQSFVTGQAKVAALSSPTVLVQNADLPDGLQQVIQVVQTIAPLFEILGALL